MASLSTGADGLHRVYFKAANGSRQTLYCGRIPKKQAEGIERAVTELERAAQYGHTAADFALAWLSEAGDDIHGKLVKYGLASPRAATEAPVAMTLGALVEHYQDRPGWKKLKPGTQLSSARAFRLLCQHFDPATPIDAITAAAAKDFYDSLNLAKGQGGRGQAVSTANVVASIVASMFNYAVDAEFVGRNPFNKLPRGTRRGNNSLVSLADSLKVLEALRTAEDKLLFAMARWGGVRTMSEQRGLTWGDVDWAKKRLLIHSPKTERHEGRESRWIPIFPELMPLLEACFNEAAEGEQHILPKYCRADNSKATTNLASAIKRAGVDPWPRLWHSLRATRQSELAKKYPAHVVSAWLGNSMKVAEKHYLMVSDDQFAEATHNPMQPVTDTPRQGETVDNDAA